MTKKIFTPQQADKTLPLVKRIVADILEKGQKLQRALLDKEKGVLPAPSQVSALQDQIEGLMKELEQLGCYYKDWSFDIGLIDFPALIEGEEVLLCWRSDEPDVRWYHGFEEGFPGRRPIPEKLLTATKEVSAQANAKQGIKG